MSTSSIKEGIIFGLGEGALTSNTTMLAYALRYANRAYRDMRIRYRFKALRTRSVFKTANGQSTYQAPADMTGFLLIKDESSDTILDQITPELFEREITSAQITNESFTSSDDTAVSLDNVGIIQFSEVVTTVAGTTTYVRDTDYTMDYSNGQITTDSTGSITDATAHYVDYLYRDTGNPTMFCLEYDADNTKYSLRMSPVPDASKIVSLLYEKDPSDLSGSVEPLWSKFEFAIECGGMYYGSKELYRGQNNVIEDFRKDAERAFAALLQLDQDLLPKQNTIPVIMRRSDYQSSDFNTRH